jgi:hypothetical protein
MEDNHQFPFTAAQHKWMGVELCQLMAAQAIKWMGQGDLWPLGIFLISPVFLIPKHSPKLWQLVINQHHLNLCLAALHCKFKSLATLIWLARQGWWAITFNLAQGYHHISIHSNSHPWFSFQIRQHNSVGMPGEQQQQLPGDDPDGEADSQAPRQHWRQSLQSSVDQGLPEC